ncbi:MAG: YncE family protein, partial [Bacteroidia bacterium]
MNIIKTGCIFFILKGFGLFLFAQTAGVATVWHFGRNAGIDFSTGTAVAIQGPFSTDEGVATISDENGNLLFSTDGVSIYNKNLALLQNGTGLWGDVSSTQSGVIVPNPANSQQYYVFTTGAEVGANTGSVYDGVAYSLVDMSLNNGLGAVVNGQKNIQLLRPATEKVTAVKHCNGTDYWVICHAWNSDAFYAYKISAAGVSAPVITQIGSVHKNWDGTGKNLESIGYLKASPNGKRIAAAICNRPNNDVEVFDFDNVTGVLSNPLLIPTAGFAYGLAFSPDNQKLYVSFLFEDIFQYDLTAPNVAASVYTVVSNPSKSWGAIQLAPDGKMYVASWQATALSIIHNPNQVGSACNFVQNGFPLLAGTFSSLGLPNFIDDFFVPELYLGQDTAMGGCSGTNSFTLDAGNGWLSYLWSNGATNQTINVSTAGLYWVEVMSSCSTLVRDSILISEISVQQNATICAGQTYILPDGSVANATGVYTTTIPSPSGCDTTFYTHLTVFQYPVTDVFAQICEGANYTLPDNNLVSNAGDYSTTLTATSGCDSVVVTHLSLFPTYNQTENIALCEGESYTLPSSITVNQSGTYTSILTTNQGCDSTIQSEVTVFALSQPQIIGDSIICENQTIQLQAVALNASFFIWNTGDSTQSISKVLTQSQGFSVTVYNVAGCASQKDSVFVKVEPNAIADFTFSPETMITPQEITLVSQSQNASTYSWNFGGIDWATGSVVVVPYPEMLDSLVVTLVADNKAHCRDTIQKTIFLENAFAANAFSPNGDG